MTRLLWLADELRAWGLDVVEVTGWRDRARPGAFDPIGVLIHHTAAPGPKDAPSLQVCIDGRRDLPGPLCQLLVARSGKVYVISAGRCNHAGAGFILGHVHDGDGNKELLGIEAENDGIGEPWPPAQVDAMAICSAAVLDHLGQPRSYCWGHKEYAPSRKIDPAGIGMDLFRAGVAGAKRPGDTTMPTTPASDAMVEQWQRQLLANGAQLGGGADGLFGRLTLEASTVVLNHRNQLLAQVAKLQADLEGANRVGGSYMTELAAARVEAKRLTGELESLRKQLQEGAAPGPAINELRGALGNLDVVQQHVAAALARLGAAR